MRLGISCIFTLLAFASFVLMHIVKTYSLLLSDIILFIAHINIMVAITSYVSNNIFKKKALDKIRKQMTVFTVSSIVILMFMVLSIIYILGSNGEKSELIILYVIPELIAVLLFNAVMYLKLKSMIGKPLRSTLNLWVTIIVLGISILLMATNYTVTAMILLIFGAYLYSKSVIDTKGVDR